MNKHFKYSILITITLLMTISLVYAQPVPIGQAKQTRPYESNPTVATPTNIAVTWGAERDGDLATSVSFQGIAAAPVGFVIFDGFDYTPPEDFTIGWVDVKIKYKHPGLGDDAYSIAYNTDGSTVFTLWLQMSLAGAAAKFDEAIRPWSNIATSSDLPWTWTDVDNFRVRIMVVRGADAVWSSFFDLYEVWLTIYESQPPASSTALSVMPPSIMGILPGEFFFVDVYLNGYTSPPGLLGYQITIKYDGSIVTATEFFTYWPFVTAGPSEIKPDYVGISYYTFAGDTVGFTETSTPCCRIYFQVLRGGAIALDLLDDRPTYITELVPVLPPSYVPPLYDSWFAGGQYLSAHTSDPTLIDLTNPIDTLWHELYPDYCKEWVLTSWEDTQPVGEPGYGELSECDQIDMANETGWTYWFHVDAVTITIHWTLKEGEGGPLTGEIGAAEPEIPMLEMPGGDPTGSKWHMIYPDYCRTIEITSWEDTGVIGDFDPSDQFDFTYLPFDVVLAGTAPPAGASLSSPGFTILYDDADFSGTWSIGEGAWDDLDMDYMYMPPAAGGIDVWLVGTEPDWFDFGSPPGPTNKYYDADVSGTWDVGEPAIDDLDLSGDYAPQVTEWAHLDAVSTDITVSQKPIPPEPPVLEFPLGIGFIMALAPIIPLIYLWRRKVWKK